MILLPGLPDFRTSGLPDFPTSRLPDFQTSGLPDFRTSGLPDFQTTCLSLNSPDQTQQQRNNCQDNKDMNKAGGTVHKESQYPSNNQYHRDKI